MAQGTVNPTIAQRVTRDRERLATLRTKLAEAKAKGLAKREEDIAGEINTLAERLRAVKEAVEGVDV
ncbi:MAG: hypothetical protein AAGI72_15465 [Pseudomonadota bacterium]